MMFSRKTARFRFATLSALCALLAASLSGCVTNPVTGKSEFALVSESQEIGMGAQNYAPARQQQGGDYVTDPELGAYVSEVGQRLARESPRPGLPYEFVVLNSSVPNAWALPGGKIAVNRGLLLALQNEAQLAAVLGHEIIHAAARHGAQQMERGVLAQTAVAGVAAAGGGELGGLANQAAGLTMMSYGRDAERESDFYGMEIMNKAGYDPRAAVQLQEIFVELQDGRQTDWVQGLFLSHPPSQERVENNKRQAQKLLAGGGPGGELGAARYQQMTRRLRQTKDAYEAYDRGQQALANKDFAEALRLANQAIAIEPAEGRFYELRGDARIGEERWAEAVANYDRAIERDASYFRPYLLRSYAKRMLGDPSGSRQDARRSYELLPTEQAKQLMGN